MATGNLILAADIGGTHITAALIDMDARRLITSSLVRRPVDSGAGPAAIIETWSQCIAAVNRQAAVPGICLAMPGPFDYDEGISLMTAQGKYDALYGLNIKTVLAKELGIRPERFYIKNDAACFLQGEVFTGVASSGFERVVGVTLGTGLGSAFYEKGHAHSADLWQLPFGESIAEDYLSTRWFVERYATVAGQQLNGVREIAAAAKEDSRGRQLFKEFGRNLGTFLCRFIEMKAAEAVVIGGNIAQAYDWFQLETTEQVRRHFPAVRVCRSLLGEQATLYGAACSGYGTLLQQEVPAD
ncbi:ROK family protein [Niabella aurantiaca]|uniref:ROK family protein n=1 Tax=Niabella aurantiaca TaxID=379900 RepID=UPI000369E95D|nr:ROK family protein [Niabella aurantiaca]